MEWKGVRPTYRKASDVLNSISQEQVFSEYLGIGYPDLYKRYLSPFRVDRDPGCRFQWYSGILYFVENTMFNNKLYWSCIDVVQYIKKCTFQEALDILWRKSYQPVTISKSNIKVFIPEIRFEKKDWSKDNLFNLSPEILEQELVFLVKNYWIKTKSGWNRNSIYNPSKTLTVAYYFPESNHVKLYFPHEQDNRWYSNCTTNDIFGWHKIKYYQSQSDKLIITKSAKDRLTLDYFLDLPTIALQNEGCFIPGDKVLDLEVMFKEIIFIYDNDLPGIYNAQKLSEKYGWKYKIIECEAKDPYEMIKEYGVENTKKLIL